MTTSDDHEVEDHDLGLSHDLPIIVERERRSLGRRGLLGIMGGVGAVALVGCADDSESTAGTGTVTDSSSTASQGGAPSGGMGGDSSVSVTEGEIPEETAGPYPGDGSNGANVLSESGVVRSDLTSSFGSASGVAESRSPSTSRSMTSTARRSPLCPAPRSTCGTATARAATPSTPTG